MHQIKQILINQIQEMPHFLTRAVQHLSREQLLQPVEGENLNLLEHLWHVADCDSDIYQLRIDRVLREELPHLEGVNVDGWPKDRGYTQRTAEDAITKVATCRQQLSELIAPLDEATLHKEGVRFNGKRTNVLELIETLLDHDRDHRWRIAAMVGKVT
ncbi:DinB family protein [Chitinimonas sp.]|uniref:DinB family protein n=1 Tax=Chitinimonas sp. TaxID=1934313 RepID=UPI002F93C628